MFFFKQKTAYEMRISDWSSDVCSSDLVLPDVVDLLHREVGIRLGMRQIGMGDPVERDARHAQALPAACRVPPSGAATRRSAASNMRKPAGSRKTVTRSPGSKRCRSEEHTSELQSLMRISYAVFCLKTKQNLHED